MKKNLKKIILISAFSIFIGSNLFADASAQLSYIEGCRAYSQGDWDSAIFLLKKAAGYSENVNPDTYYMLITSEMNSGDNAEALNYCDYFLNTFPDSLYASRVKYFRGRVLYNLEEYERSIIELSDFCHQYENDDMYPSALFYIGESLYSAYKYDEATSIFERILYDYPMSDKSIAAQYRIDSIMQRAREEKLLYLLKQTGEEYLSSKEDYEKQLRMYNSESVYSARQRLIETQNKNADLERQISDLEEQIAILNQEIRKMENQNSQYASQMQAALEERQVFEQAAQKAEEERAAVEAATARQIEEAATRAAIEATRIAQETAEQKAVMDAELKAAEEKAAREAKEAQEAATAERLRQLKEKAFEAQKKYDASDK